jgi:hypothetical protein
MDTCWPRRGRRRNWCASLPVIPRASVALGHHSTGAFHHSRLEKLSSAGCLLFPRLTRPSISTHHPPLNRVGGKASRYTRGERVPRYRTPARCGMARPPRGAAAVRRADERRWAPADCGHEGLEEEARGGLGNSRVLRRFQPPGAVELGSFRSRVPGRQPCKTS